MEKIEEKTTADLQRLKANLEKQLQPLIYERVWTRGYISQLPDSAFALMYKENDRVVRKLPHHRADESIDLPHLRNALARAPQMKDVSEEERNKAIAHLEKHAKAAGVGAAAEGSKEPFKHKWKEQEEIEFQVAPEPTMDELIESIEDVVEQINARLDTIENQLPKKEVPSEPKESKEVIELKKEIETLTGQVEVLTQQKRELQEALAKVEQGRSLGEGIVEPPASAEPTPTRAFEKALDLIEGLIPHSQVINNWGAGPKTFVNRLKHQLRLIRNELTG